MIRPVHLGLALLLLAGLEVCVCQLVHGLDEEGARAHGGLADGEPQDLFGGLLAAFVLGGYPHLARFFEDLLADGMFALRQRFDGPGVGIACGGFVLQFRK